MRLIRCFFLFLPNAKMKGTCESCAATVLLPGDLLAVLPASSQPEQQLKLLPAACCHVQQIRWEIKRTSVTTQRNQHFQSETLWLSFKWLLQDDTYHILKGPFPLYWSYWEPGETCSALSMFSALSIDVFAKWIPWRALKPWCAPHCQVLKRRQCRRTRRSFSSSKDVSEESRTQGSPPARSQEQSSPVAALSVTPHSHNVHTYTCHHTQVHPRSGIPSLDLSLSQNLVSISSVSCF